MVLVDEYAALLALVDRPPASLSGQSVALTYSRAYQLTRALLDPGPGRLRARSRFTRLADELTEQDRHLLQVRLADPDTEHVLIVDPRPAIRATAAIQNTYALSLLQAETLAVAAANDWSVRFLDADSATETVRRAAQQLGLDLEVIGR
ncbi:MAG: hypothetical protein KY395_01980 [Actinobacteria bacterium]|nr:hypothetical protein [Actinomycetota bacterium]